MARLAQQGFAGSPRAVVMVGDRIDTDARGARHGWTTCLVETGCHTAADRFPESADLVAADLRALVGGGGAAAARWQEHVARGAAPRAAHRRVVRRARRAPRAAPRRRAARAAAAHPERARPRVDGRGGRL